MNPGSWVGDRFGVGLVDEAGLPLDGLVALALRRNPRRAHLLVSGVLGKHVPVDPRTVLGTAHRLGSLVAAELVGAGEDGANKGGTGVDGTDVDGAVLGFAETATGLGHGVAEALGAPYVHSTRRIVATARPFVEFREDHSHATDHRLLPEDPGLLATGDVLVLVDDELSTGRTAMNTIAALHAVVPRPRYVMAALVDLRPPSERAVLAAFAAELGVEISVIALGSGRLDVPDGFASVAAAEVAGRAGSRPVGSAVHLAEVAHAPVPWPAWVSESGRHGMTTAQTAAAREAAAGVARSLADAVGRLGPRVLVLGTEELMHAPTLIAAALADTGLDVRVSSTTRSPVLVVDEPGYPVRSMITFPSHDRGDGAGPRFAYNVATAFPRADGAAGPPADDIVLVVDDDSDPVRLEAGLVAALRPLCRRVHVVTLPCHRPIPEPLRGPVFGSYAPDEVSWLLTDLSHVELEAPTEEREEAIQSGGAHYAESLPVEFQPDARYLELFGRALDDSAARVAHAVGVLTEIVLAERGTDVVLASLARAGTPVGVLVRRWARFAHGIEPVHHTLSIVRGRGIDLVALRLLARDHDPRDVVFVDGWTGKGAIARELAAAVTGANTALGTSFDPALAVLADPGRCVATFGTREDFLVPSACLNSTVSGLVSRTVLNRDILAPGQFHGAKFYRELAGSDVSARFLDAVTARFADVAPDVSRDWPLVRASDRAVTWAGWDEVTRIGAQYGIEDVTLVKPGVGETTRVLLRRVPWAVLVRAGTGVGDGLEHVRLLAEQRGVPVHEVVDLTYRCVGLIRPHHARGGIGIRGATGADGSALR